MHMRRAPLHEPHSSRMSLFHVVDEGIPGILIWQWNVFVIGIFTQH